MKCSHPKCERQASCTVIDVRVAPFRDTQLCEEHARQLFSQACGTASDGRSISRTIGRDAECRVALILVHVNAPLHEVLLQTKDGQEHLILSVGPIESSMIVGSLYYRPVPRPLTHDLVRHAIELLGASIAAVRIERRPVPGENWYRAAIVVQCGSQQRYLDCRPTDAVCLAIRAAVPMLLCEKAVPAQDPDPEQWEQLPSGKGAAEVLYRAKYAFRKNITLRRAAVSLGLACLSAGLPWFLAVRGLAQPLVPWMLTPLGIVFAAVGAVQLLGWWLRWEDELRIDHRGVTYGRRHWPWTKLTAISIRRHKATGNLYIVVRTRARSLGAALVVDDQFTDLELRRLADRIAKYVTQQGYAISIDADGPGGLPASAS